MINAWADWLAGIPLPLRLAAVAVLGCLAGGQVNRGVYRLAFHRRRIGPWTAPDSKAPPRRWTDRLPVVGWWGLRREASLHGRGYWIRPLLVELVFLAGAPLMYWWEVDQQGLLPTLPGLSASPLVLHCWFVAHFGLACLLMMATLIDFDERTIPDAVTLPGTLFALVWVAAFPWALPPDLDVDLAANRIQLEPLLARPWRSWPAAWDGGAGLATGLTIWLAYVLAISPRSRFTVRRGWLKALQYQAVSTYRYGSWRHVVLAAVGAAGVAAAWNLPAPAWRSTLTALWGLAYGGGLVWTVRIVAGVALRQEAMGFGDVTLMGMIGALLGWQATILVFFMAPFAAVVISVIRFLTSRDRHIAFGPYLSLAAMTCILGWRYVWFDQFQGIFEVLGPLISPLLLLAVATMGPLLILVRAITRGGQ